MSSHHELWVLYSNNIKLFVRRLRNHLITSTKNNKCGEVIRNLTQIRTLIIQLIETSRGLRRTIFLSMG
jgi:hypothetical protein